MAAWRETWSRTRRTVRLLLWRDDGEVAGAEQRGDGVGAAAACLRDARAEQGGVDIGTAAVRVRAARAERGSFVVSMQLRLM